MRGRRGWRGRRAPRFCAFLLPVASPASAKPSRVFCALKTWCTGEDSNLRSSKERQIYSLLPLTTRPPVRKAQNLELMTGIKDGTGDSSYYVAATRLTTLPLRLPGECCCKCSPNSGADDRD